MVKVLADHFLGLTVYCNKCSCLLGFNGNDIYEDKWIYCPRCKEKVEVNLKEIQPHFTISFSDAAKNS